MKVDPITLKYLLESMSEGVRDMFLVLSAKPTQGALQALARVAHKLKGEATVVGFDTLSRKICSLEDAIRAYQRLSRLDRSHFQTLAMHLKAVVCQCEHIRKNAIRMAGMARNQRIERNPAKGITVALQVLAQNVAKGCGKSVRLNLEHFQPSDIPPHLRKKVQDIAVQLIRNAIAHGIESPEERKAKQKAPCGTVSLKLSKSGKLLLLTVRDNGRGIELEKIRRRLVIDYERSVQEIAKLSEQALLHTLFEPGFSTLLVQQHHAGRGVGLDLVRNTAQSLGGAVDIQYRQRVYCQFVVRLPLLEQKRQADAIPLLVNAVVPTIPLLKLKANG